MLFVVVPEIFSVSLNIFGVLPMNDDLLDTIGFAQVETLGIDPRLLEKWQARKDTRRDGKAKGSSSRLFFSLATAMCAACLRWLYVSDGRGAFRFRTLLAIASLATLICCGLL